MIDEEKLGVFVEFVRSITLLQGQNADERLINSANMAKMTIHFGFLNSMVNGDKKPRLVKNSDYVSLKSPEFYHEVDEITRNLSLFTDENINEIGDIGPGIYAAGKNFIKKSSDSSSQSVKHTLPFKLSPDAKVITLDEIIKLADIALNVFDFNDEFKDYYEVGLKDIKDVEKIYNMCKPILDVSTFDELFGTTIFGLLLGYDVINAEESDVVIILNREAMMVNEREYENLLQTQHQQLN